MKFLYFYRVPVPDPRADAIQIVNTCAAIARAGADVDLRVETLSATSTVECLAYYGIAGLPAEGPGRLEVSAVGTHWSWPFLHLKTSASALRNAAGAKPACLFVREVRPYVPGLIARARSAGLKVIFEAHNVSASLVKEKEQKTEGGPQAGSRVFTLTSTEGKSALKMVGEENPEVRAHTHGDVVPAGASGHDDHDDEHGAAEPPPPNLDLSPAPPPRPTQTTAEARRLHRKAEQRAALEAAILGAADGLICTQKATLEGLRPHLRPRVPAAVLGNGTQLPPRIAAAEDRPRDIDVLYCGSLKPWKGVDTLVAAMQTLYPYKLTVVGPGTREDIARLQQAALAVGMLERLKILPPVKPAEVWDLYARAKVGAIPLPGERYVEARDFTSPLKLFEMMAAGLPIVCSRLPSLQEYITDGREAMVVTPDDPRALAQALRRLLADEPARASLAAAARLRVAEFTWDERGRRILTFAETLFA